jgi:hypothetical protein
MIGWQLTGKSASMTPGTRKPVLDAAEFEVLYQRLRQVPPWGP